MRRRVVISGLGVVSPFGIGTSTFWNGISRGESAARLIDTFDTAELPTRFAASVPESNQDIDERVENQKILKTLSRSGKFAVIAAQESVKDAGFHPNGLNPSRLGTSLGAGGLGVWDLDHANQITDITLSSLQGSVHSQPVYSKVWKSVLEQVHPLTPLKALSNIPTAHIAIQYNARGVCQTITTACTSSAQAIGEAFRQIQYGHADAMIAGGSDSMINPNGLVAFSMLGVMSTDNGEYRTAARPFDKRRNGFMLGEGSAVFVLEELELCRKRGGRPYAEVIGYSSTCDAFRLTDEPPEAWGSVSAMGQVLEEAGIQPRDVDYINAHGTGTPMNDKTETYAIKTVFGEDAYKLGVSSTKSMIGHLVAAAGAVEFAACVLSIQHQTMPPTINYRVPDPECDLDYVVDGARQAPVTTVLSNSFGFGGQNACLLIQKYEEP